MIPIGMPGEGSIMYMIAVIRNNKKLLRKKNRFQKDRTFLQGESMEFEGSHQGIKVEPISQERLREIREKILAEQKKSLRRTVLLMMVIFPITAFLLYITFRDFSFGFPSTTKNHEQVQQEEQTLKKEKYLFYLEDGDKWLQKKQYHNAIFQYKKASELFSSECDAKYRLALAYSYQCQYHFEGCEEGKKITDRLLEQFPYRQELQDIQAIFTHWGTGP